MQNQELAEKFSSLSTPLVADAALRLQLPVRFAPAGIASLIPQSRLAGRALPARHFGSVDVFLEAMQNAERGDILVIDNLTSTLEVRCSTDKNKNAEHPTSNSECSKPQTIRITSL